MNHNRTHGQREKRIAREETVHEKDNNTDLRIDQTFSSSVSSLSTLTSPSIPLFLHEL